MTDEQVEKIVKQQCETNRILTEICRKLDAQKSELENLKNLFLKYDVELLLENEEFREG